MYRYPPYRGQACLLTTGGWGLLPLHLTEGLELYQTQLHSCLFAFCRKWKEGNRCGGAVFISGWLLSHWDSMVKQSGHSGELLLLQVCRVLHASVLHASVLHASVLHASVREPPPNPRPAVAGRVARPCSRLCVV